jgi:hypothetical protein
VPGEKISSWTWTKFWNTTKIMTDITIYIYIMHMLTLHLLTGLPLWSTQWYPLIKHENIKHWTYLINFKLKKNMTGEVTSCLGCDTVPLCEYILAFQKNRNCLYLQQCDTECQWTMDISMPVLTCQTIHHHSL